MSVDAVAISDWLKERERGAGSGWRSRATSLAAQLLPKGLEHMKHAIIVTDGVLAALPFEALNRRGGALLIETHDITYVPTAAMILRMHAPARELSAPWSKQLVAFADPQFTSARLDRELPRLPASAAEVRSIAAVLGGRAILHVGADDQKRYLERGHLPPLLHIASHAFVDAEAVEQSRILFAAANPADTKADYLFLKEAYELPLSNVELAVLSACDTERGRIVRGEGVQSFSRAFLAAGVRSTVTTLWRVPDQSTAMFMKVFYHHLQRGESRAEALRLAKLRFLRSGTELSDPHYWGAFVLTGEGSGPVPRALRWRSVALAASAILALCVLLLALQTRLQRGESAAIERR
jgi:CHAT domain-containing protein